MDFIVLNLIFTFNQFLITQHLIANGFYQKFI
jgi:hypothetical protein